jgi:hypothetical protein
MRGSGIIDALAAKDVARQGSKFISFNHTHVCRSQDHVVTVS